MTMLTSAELDAIRDDIENELLPESVAIIALTSGTGRTGVHTMTESTRATVAGRIDRLQRQDSSGIIADAEIGRTYYTLTVTHDADLRDGDRVRINSITYEVLQVQRGQSNRFVRRAIVAAKDEGN